MERKKIKLPSGKRITKESMEDFIESLGGLGDLPGYIKGEFAVLRAEEIVEKMRRNNKNRRKRWIA